MTNRYVSHARHSSVRFHVRVNSVLSHARQPPVRFSRTSLLGSSFTHVLIRFFSHARDLWVRFCLLLMLIQQVRKFSGIYWCLFCLYFYCCTAVSPVFTTFAILHPVSHSQLYSIVSILIIRPLSTSHIRNRRQAQIWLLFRTISIEISFGISLKTCVLYFAGCRIEIVGHG